MNIKKRNGRFATTISPKVQLDFFVDDDTTLNHHSDLFACAVGAIKLHIRCSCGVSHLGVKLSLPRVDSTSLIVIDCYSTI